MYLSSSTDLLVPRQGSSTSLACFSFVIGCSQAPVAAPRPRYETHPAEPCGARCISQSLCSQLVLLRPHNDRTVEFFPLVRGHVLEAAVFILATLATPGFSGLPRD